MRLIDADKLKRTEGMFQYQINDAFDRLSFSAYTFEDVENAPTVEAIPIEQLLSILPKYDDYIHTKTYPYDETMENIYSKGHEEGWNACLKAIKEELDYWERNEQNTSKTN